MRRNAELGFGEHRFPEHSGITQPECSLMRNDALEFEKPKAMTIMHQLKFYQATVHGKKGNIYRYRDEKQAIGDNEFCKPD
jgi:hypothetical protein